jgi:cell division protein FtsB
MKRWLSLVLLLVVALLVVWAGYQGYARLRALEGRVTALETRLQAQEQVLKALGERVGKVEEEVFKVPTPPLSLP